MVNLLNVPTQSIEFNSYKSVYGVRPLGPELQKERPRELLRRSFESLSKLNRPQTTF